MRKKKSGLLGSLVVLCASCFVISVAVSLTGSGLRSVGLLPTLPPRPSPTFTPAPTPTPPALSKPIPTPTFAGKKSTIQPVAVTPPAEALVTAGSSSVNLRRGPGTDFEVVGVLAAHQSLPIIGRSAEADWWQVPGGWIAAAVTSASRVDDTIPVVEPAAVTQPQEAPLTEPAAERAGQPAQAAPGPATASANLQPAQVVAVVDGDTIDVVIDGAQYRLRYILIDTPERDQPFGAEATAANRALVGGKTVWLEKDVSDVDRYGRLLRYVYFEQGQMVQEQLLLLGLAKVATYPPDVKYVDQFLARQEIAQDTAAGIWIEQPPAQPPGPASPGSGLTIVAVDKQAEFVDIQNMSDQRVDLAGWTLLSEKGQQSCALSGAPEPGETLRVWALAADSGLGGLNCGFESNIWNNSEPDPAVLIDPGGGQVSRK